MKFSKVEPMMCGNAVRMVISPDPLAIRWRVLRKETNDFSSQDDNSAFIVHDGTERFITDSRFLTNGNTYYYAVFGEFEGSSEWSVPAIESATPIANFIDQSIDTQEIVRDRIEVSLRSMMQRGLVSLTRQTVQVISVPFYQQGSDLPVVTVLYGGGSASDHGIGDLVSIEDDDSQGWIEDMTLEVTVWSLNAQERNILRRAIEACIASSLSLWSEMGLTVGVSSIQDSEDFESMNSPVYQTSIRLGCQSVVGVSLSGFGMIKNFSVDLI